MQDYDSYVQRARLMTSIHATPEPEAGSSSTPTESNAGATSATLTSAPAPGSKAGKDEGGAGDKKKLDKKRSLKRL